MQYQINGQPRRRGAVTPLFALLALFLLGVVAFAVDIGWMVLVQQDLQNAADASALAGVNALMDGYVNYQLATTTTQKTSFMNSAMTTARTNARTYAGYNAAGGVSSLTLNDGDIEFGFTDASGNYTALVGTSPFPNTIKVKLRRDSQANGSLALFFAPALGVQVTNLTASAAATMYGGIPNGFSSNPSSAIYAMPMTYDVSHWTAFTKTGLDPDGNQTLYNGNPALTVYPSIKAPGNFGQLSLDNSHVGASTEVGWVNNGIGSSEVQSLASGDLIPLSSHDTTKWDWVGDTGMKQSLVSAINDNAGKQFILPLFNAYNPSTTNYSAGTGNGSSYNYQVVQFVAVTIVPADKTVVVQPSAMVNADITWVGGTPTPIGTGSATGLITVFAAPKLTQ